MGIVQVVLCRAAAGHGEQVTASQVGGDACPGLLSDYIAAVKIVVSGGRTHSFCCADSLRVIGAGTALAVYRLGCQLVEAVVAIARNCRDFILRPPLAFRQQIPVGVIGVDRVLCLTPADVLASCQLVVCIIGVADRVGLAARGCHGTAVVSIVGGIIYPSDLLVLWNPIFPFMIELQ